MKTLSKILAAAALTICVGAGTDSYADTPNSSTFGGISTPPKVTPFNLRNVTLINNTFGIRADRPLSAALLLHAFTVIGNLSADGRIDQAGNELLFNDVLRHTTRAICRSVLGPAPECLMAH